MKTHKEILREKFEKYLKDVEYTDKTLNSINGGQEVYDAIYEAMEEAADQIYPTLDEYDVFDKHWERAMMKNTKKDIVRMFRDIYFKSKMMRSSRQVYADMQTIDFAVCLLADINQALPEPLKMNIVQTLKNWKGKHTPAEN